MRPVRKHGHGPHGKSNNKARKSKRKRYHDRKPKIKGGRVFKSSHGKWTWEALKEHGEKAHRQALTGRRRKKTRDSTSLVQGD